MNSFFEDTRKARILIVDDNPRNIMLLSRLLAESGYEAVQDTTNPGEVVALHTAWRFDLILLDIEMPHMNGYQVLESLVESNLDDYAPVLMLTARTDPESQIKALQLGARDFVTKPFNQTELLNRIRNMLEVRMLYERQRRQGEILEGKVRERTDQLYRTQLEVVRRLGLAGEYRDNETGMHVLRMGKSCQCLAQAAGFSEGRAEVIRHTAPLHDVGKIGIPDRILLKPGKLDADEWEVMKTHVNIGAGILADDPSEIIRLAQVIVLSHHEKWDGSGYPRGLTGADIPIEGRVAALCDVFDALTSDRPYKDAWPVEDAVAYITDNAGYHFDPELVRLFKDIVSNLIAIRVRFPDEPPPVEPALKLA